MAQQGNKDFVALTDTYFVLDTLVGQIGNGDDLSVIEPGWSIVLDGVEYVVAANNGASGLTLTTEHGSTGPIDGATGYYQEKPKYLTRAERAYVYGVDATEMGATGGRAHAGWVKSVPQAGYVKEITLNTTGASGYNPASLPTVIFSGTGGASGVAVVSAAGVLTAVTVTVPGSYTTTAPTVTIGSTGATGVVGTVVMGGRFGRTIQETLGIIANNSQAAMGDAEDTIFSL